MKLKDKVALVTGAAQGIGKAIAATLAKEGAQIIITDINLELATQTAREIESLGVKSLALKMNVSDQAEVEAGIKQAVETFKRIDILVNNAGITKDGLFVRMKKEDWDAVINVNLTGVFLVSKVVSLLMMRQSCGKIINISSVVGEMGNMGQANYSASKAGLLGLTKTLARELASRSVTVNAIAPGFIQTAMTDKLTEDARKKLFELIPLGRLGSPEDVANAALFLASSEADYITGQVINVNGGMYM
jgi:3-oxoacyl-[acyl-carrier protein] reductase